MFSILIVFTIFSLILCQSQPQGKCDNSLCNHEAICSLKDEVPSCKCVEKFFKGDTCSEVIDHCNPNPCRNKGTCRPYLGHYFCDCPKGFTGQKCTSKKDTFTGLHIHYNHIAQLGREQVFLLTAQSLGTVQTVMDFYTAEYVIDGASFSSGSGHFEEHKRLSDLADSLKLRHSDTLPYENGFYRISRGTFWKLGVQQMTLDLSDEEDSESFFTENFNILVFDPTGQMCLPVIRLPKCENPRQSLHIDIVSFNFIEPVVQQRCAELSHLRVQWSVRNYIDSVLLHSFPEDESSSLVIPPYTMWFDFRDDYVQSYLIQGDLREIDSDGSLVSRTLLRCYVFVDSTNVQAKITGGPRRRVNVDSSFIIDGSKSRDYARSPDSDQDLHYKWSCASEDGANDFCLADMGSDSKLLIPRKALDLGSTYKYKLEVQSTINIYSTSVVYQSITAVSDDPLLLNFECLRNCEQFKFSAGRPVHLRVKCIDCPRGDVSYSIHDASGTEVSTSSRVIVTEKSKTEISFEAIATLGALKGTVSVKLKENKPPTNGKCAVLPASGIAYQTIFQIICSDFEDPRPIKFTYKIGKCTLDYGRNKILTTRLFPTQGGSCKVTVSVCDDLNACRMITILVPLSPLSPPATWLEFLQQSGSDLYTIIADGDRLSVNALINSIIPHIQTEEALGVTEYIVKSLEHLKVERLLVVEQVLNIAHQLFEAAPLSSTSAVLISKLLSKVSRGLEHSIRNKEIIELEQDTHEQMLNNLLQIMARASTKVEDFSAIYATESMPPKDPFDEDYADYGELNVEEVLNISNWLHAFNEMHKCLQLMGVASAFQQLPEETPLIVKEKGISFKSLVVDTSERPSLSLSGLQAHAYLQPDFLQSLDQQDVAVQFTVFGSNPFWWYPEQYKVNTEVMSLGVYSRDPTPQSIQKEMSFTMALKQMEQPESTYIVRGHINGSLDMPIYERMLPPHAVLIVKFLLSTEDIRLLLTVGQKPRSYMLAQASKVSAAATFLLVNPNSTPIKAFIALAAPKQISFEFSLSIRVCLTWSTSTSDWTSEHCSVGKETNATHIHCFCSHLSMFAGKVHSTFALLQPSRSIRSSLTVNFNLITAYFVIVTLLLASLFIAWRRDLSASRRVIALNIKPRQSTLHKYLVTVYTNGHACAATSSNITIQLHGTLLSSTEFTLYSLLERNVRTSFLIPCPMFLGALQSVSLRHDSFGRSPSWHCHAVRVRDETTGEEYFCIVDKWLSNYDSTSCSASAKPLKKTDLDRKTLIFRETLSNEFANWYAQQVFYSPRLYTIFSATEKTAIFITRVCVVLIGTMVVFGPTTIFTYEEERETYYYMLLDFGKLISIALLCHLFGLITDVVLRYLFSKLRAVQRMY